MINVVAKSSTQLKSDRQINFDKVFVFNLASWRICIRNFSYKNTISFQRELGDIDWSEMYSQSDTKDTFFRVPQSVCKALW